MEAREENILIPWNRFNILLFEKYFPKFLANKTVVQFLELKQGEMTAAEYEAKFSELARFAPYQVDTEKRKTRRFELELTPWIYNL